MSERMSLAEAKELLSKKSGSKYGNVKTTYKGQIFDSKKEADYAATLDNLKHAAFPKDRVHSYERQVPFRIVVDQVDICTYIADFRVNYADGREEIIDVKGFKTAIYKIKKKLVKAQYGLDIIEV